MCGLKCKTRNLAVPTNGSHVTVSLMEASKESKEMSASEGAAAAAMAEITKQAMEHRPDPESNFKADLQSLTQVRPAFPVDSMRPEIFNSENSLPLPEKYMVTKCEFPLGTSICVLAEPNSSHVISDEFSSFLLCVSCVTYLVDSDDVMNGRGRKSYNHIGNRR